MRRVAVTGIGVISPLGNNAADFFAHLLAGHSGVSRLPAPLLAHPRKPAALATRTHVGAKVEFDASVHFSPQRLRMLDRVSQFALAAAAQAVRDAGLNFDACNKQRAGVFIGTGMGGAQTTDESYFTFYGEACERVKPFSVLMAMNNAAAAWIGIEYKIEGPNMTYSTACSSSAVAIGEAARRIASGELDIVIAGGAEAPLTDGTLAAWNSLKTLAHEDPNDASASCKPFAHDRNGLVLGEGAAVVILEEWQHAIARGVTIHAELIGYGLVTDTTHITRPSINGQAAAMGHALSSAALTPEHIDYINAHGTGTQANDAVETAAIKQVFAGHAARLPVSSTKSMHGHLLGAAGALEFVATVLTLEQQCIPPTINLCIKDPACDLDYVPEGARHDAKLSVAMSNSFAFGGTNAVLICRAWRSV